MSLSIDVFKNGIMETLQFQNSYSKKHGAEYGKHQTYWCTKDKDDFVRSRTVDGGVSMEICLGCRETNTDTAKEVLIVHACLHACSVDCLSQMSLLAL